MTESDKAGDVVYVPTVGAGVHGAVPARVPARGSWSVVPLPQSTRSRGQFIAREIFTD